MNISLRNFWVRHAIIGLLAVLIIYLFWISRPMWSPDMRFWRAVGDGAFILFFFTLVIGPLFKLFPNIFTKFISWRKELGIWTALIALTHTYLIFKGWFAWDLMSLLGYEFIPELGRYARMEPGFGLANIVGLFALFFLLLLLATSSARAIRFLGGNAWKYLHYSANIVFYLVVIHVLYFLFIHYTVSFHRPAPPPNWFAFPFLTISLLLVILQIAGFIKIVKIFKHNSQRLS